MIMNLPKNNPKNLKIIVSSVLLKSLCMHMQHEIKPNKNGTRNIILHLFQLPAILMESFLLLKYGVFY